MAMRKEPDRRYPSVEALADDITRHLLGKPVLARQGDWRYNTAKFMRRHLLPVSAVAAAFLTLALIAGVTLWQNHRIELARDQTAQERDRAQQVIGFSGGCVLRRPTHSRRRVTKPRRRICWTGAPPRSWATQPTTGSAGATPREHRPCLPPQGLSERAIPLFEQSVAIRRDERPVDNRRTASALANLARALTDGGHLVSAEAYLKQSLELSRKGDQGTSTATADILVQYAQFELSAKSDPERSRKLFEEALAIYRSLLGEQHLSVAVTLSGLASAASWMDDFAAAEHYEREAIEIFRGTVQPQLPRPCGGAGQPRLHPHAAGRIR